MSGEALARVVPLDGRSARRERSRDAVLDAIMTLFEEGVVPTAAMVAERAGVSERSLFRIFGSREDLLAAAVDRVIDQVSPVFTDIDPDGTVGVRIDALVAQRARLYGRIGPIRRLVPLLAQESEAVQERLAVTRRFFRDQITTTFADELAALAAPTRRSALAAAETATSFETWEYLQGTEGLSAGRARDAMARLLRGALGVA